MRIVKEEIFKRLTLEAYPKEACALCTEDEVFPITNVSELKDNFELCPKEIAELYRKLGGIDSIKYIWHSHTHKNGTLFDIRTPSEEDLALYERFKLQLLISGYDGNEFYPTIEFPERPTALKPLLGLPYICGVNDCGTLIRNAFLDAYGIELFYKLQPSYLHVKSWPRAVKEFLECNCFEEVSGFPVDNDVLVVPMLHMNEAHGVLVRNNGQFVIDQRETSVLRSIEEYLIQPHKHYRLNLERFMEMKRCS